MHSLQITSAQELSFNSVFSTYSIQLFTYNMVEFYDNDVNAPPVLTVT